MALLTQYAHNNNILQIVLRLNTDTIIVTC